ncbi:hypothetical protein [Ornithinimicrobium kibberense]|uniref:hypothetical protein n=1 Tax=Ornithinimicrobium kibberense TaxID=282060 RepID=UPI00360FA0EA
MATPSTARRAASLVRNIIVGRPASAAPTATRKATVTRSGSSRPVVRLMAALFMTGPFPGARRRGGTPRR